MKKLEIKHHISFKDLQTLYNTAQSGKIAKRYLAILQLYLGNSVPEAARHVYASEVVVRLWVHRWNTEGSEGLLDRKRDGRPPKLSKEQREELISTVLSSPKDAGYDNSTWVLKSISAHVKTTYGEDYTLSGLNRMLKRENLTRLVPRPMPAKADPKKK